VLGQGWVEKLVLGDDSSSEVMTDTALSREGLHRGVLNAMVRGDV
jgi:hypothetical protein